MKVSIGNIEIGYIDGHLIKFDKTNLSIQKHYEIITSNKYHTLLPYFMILKIKIYLPTENAIIFITKYIPILNILNRIF